MTGAYKLYDGSMSVPEMRATALKYYFERKSIESADSELIVGIKGDTAQASPTFTMLCCHSPQNMQVTNERDLINFAAIPEDMKLQKEVIIPYWKHRSTRHKILCP